MSVVAASESNKPDLVIWTGPIWAGNLAKVVWSHQTELLTLSCEGSDNCSALAGNLPATGKLPALISAHGKKIDDYGKIMMGSFSAGHGLANVLLSDPDAVDRISAFGAFDSYYTGPTPGIKKGYLAFAEKAAAGHALMWTSCSSIPDRKWLSCEDSIRPLLDAIDPSEDTLPSDLAALIKMPTYFVQKYGFVHAAYGTTYKHGEHATVIAPAVFQAWMSPMVHGSESQSFLKTAGIVLGTIAAAFGVWKFGTWLRRR